MEIKRKRNKLLEHKHKILDGWSTICCSTIRRSHRFTWAVGNGRPHVHEAEGAAGQRLPAAGAAGDFGLGWRAADAVLAEATALVRHWRAAVRDGLAAEVAAHKHLSHGCKHKGRADKGGRWNWRACAYTCTLPHSSSPAA